MAKVMARRSAACWLFLETTRCCFQTKIAFIEATQMLWSPGPAVSKRNRQDGEATRSVYVYDVRQRAWVSQDTEGR